MDPCVSFDGCDRSNTQTPFEGMARDDVKELAHHSDFNTFVSTLEVRTVQMDDHDVVRDAKGEHGREPTRRGVESYSLLPRGLGTTRATVPRTPRLPGVAESRPDAAVGS